MAPSPGPIHPLHPGGPSRVIQGFFPGERPIIQASPAPASPVRPQAPAPVQARPAPLRLFCCPGRPRRGETGTPLVLTFTGCMNKLGMKNGYFLPRFSSRGIGRDPRQRRSPELESSPKRPPMATLTPEQRQAIQRAGEEPVRLADPETQAEYVLLKADVYDRIRPLPKKRGPPIPSR